MTRRHALSLLGPLAFAQDLTIRTDVRLVRHLVTVKDARGQLVGSLNKDDFTVLDSGVPQDIAVFERQTAQPLSISVLVDASGSTAKEARYELDAVSRFLKAVFRDGNTGDAVSLYSFNWEVVQLTGFTRNVGQLQKKLSAMRSEAGTSVYDAVYFASSELRQRDGRHVIVIVTDGGDTASTKKFDDALRSAQSADAVLYAVLVMPNRNDPGRNVGGENALTALSTQTGGRMFVPDQSRTLDASFDEILRDLRTQYLLGYYPRKLPADSPAFRQIQVQAKPAGLTVTTRTGYYAD